MAAFFNLSENSALLGMPLLQIQGIKKSAADDVGTDTLYALLVGGLCEHPGEVCSRGTSQSGVGARDDHRHVCVHPAVNR